MQGDWERLTRWSDGKWVIFRPCDADNMSLQIVHDTLVIGWGQDLSWGIIRSFAESELPGVHILTVFDQDEQALKICRLMWDDETYNRAKWWLWDGDEPVLMLRAELADQYKVIEQPCHECWYDCEENPGTEPVQRNH
jgi:hypothetical protein